VRRAGIDKEFWQDRRILLTGHTGFKGAWLSLVLSRLGSKIIGLSLAPEEQSLFLQAGVAHHLSAHHLVDLENEPAVRALVSDANPEIVIHFAAQSLVREAWRAPRKTFMTNVIGSVNLFEALRRCNGIRTILTTTTDKVYLNSERGASFREEDPLGGIEPYSASKAAAEFVVSAYRGYFAGRAASVVARAGNIIGGGDWSMDRVIPDAMRAAMQGVPLEVRNPKSVRPWQFVLDALEGYLLLVENVTRERPDCSSPARCAWNFGPPTEDDPVTVERICRWIEDQWPRHFTWRYTQDAEDIHESRLLFLDSSRAQQDLGWSPRLSTREAVLATLDWYAAYMDGKSPYDICSRQIDDHFCIAGTTT
jgi:CDP-glucose 4,6-dehydratase